MPVTTLHLSSQNSTLLGDGSHELSLLPGLEIPHDASPQCYLHTLSFTNTIVNVSHPLYDNAGVALSINVAGQGNFPADPGGTFVIPQGSYSLRDMMRALSRQIQASLVHVPKHLIAPTEVTHGTGATAHTYTWATDADFDNPSLRFPTVHELMEPTKLMPDTTVIPYVLLEADSTLNRVRMWSAYKIEAAGNTMLTNFLGFESSQLGKIPQNVVAANAARVDRARAVGFHCPSIVSGVYSSSGRLGGSQLALVPIDVDIGRIQVYTTKVPIRLVARTAGSKLQRILFYLSDEEGGKIEMQGERFDATVVLEW
eukprot:COSAG06_NODE_369_length_16731_cov_5.684644_11_plen_313_part_00